MEEMLYPQERLELDGVIYEEERELYKIIIKREVPGSSAFYMFFQIHYTVPALR